MALTLDSTSAVDLIMQAVADRLALFMITNATDDARAGLVRTGLLQDDPTNKRINILIHPGGPSYLDGFVTGEDGIPQHYINASYGGSFYKRHIRVEFSLFFTQESSRDNARKKALVAMARARHAIETLDISSVDRDSFGERPFEQHIIQEHVYEGGGEGDYNWRGEMVVKFLTEYEAI